ncbi:hypothetical protein [Trichlorobacter lovleyi]|uniref:Uncharacterized protein n=1 Tax=Trichlorobacter lovleyi (strain ATCC BAA-1151 / DSM 17278 / SZ) TaxID=398767 RepID=B3E6J2_TRIL1|nr:hypothetical protein [Trichlorobacter lovleyi]ACD94817.1 hypothetical protein Glov_1095 [Trichlorobacter lovleyi SZ]
MKTINKRIFAIVPIIAFALTIVISNGITRTIEHRRAATSDQSQPADETLNGSYSNLINTFNASSTR